MAPTSSASTADAQARSALADAAPAVFWTDRGDRPRDGEPVHGCHVADLAIVGAGFTGLWAASLARAREPGARITIVDADAVASGASGRNGGFLAASLTHGLLHGLRHWPDEIETLLRFGRENLAAIAAFVDDHDIDADLRLCGKTTVATEAYQVPMLESSAALHERYGETVEVWDGEATMADIASPTYRAGLRIRSGYALVDPAGLAWGLARAARARDVVIHERSRATGIRRRGHGVRVELREGSVDADRVIIATSAFPPPLRRVRRYIAPVYDYVLVTEPLSDAQWSAVGWAERQGITDAGNEFHYYRPTADGRILFGGYDAVYHFGGRVEPELEQRESSHLTLARHFFTTFPQLEGIRFSHRWGGAIDSTSRFTPVFGTALDGRVAYALGYTGLGVGSSRFGANVALDLLEGRPTARTELAMVRRKPIPFPPEPLRWLGVRITQAELARQDRNGGRASIWLRLLDRLGMGFSS